MGSTGIVDFDAAGDKVMKPSFLAHVVLRTNPANLKRQRDFYLTFLGGHVQYENEYLCFITYDEEHHRLALVAFPEAAPKIQNSCGLEHIAFTFSSLSDLLLAYRQRLKHDIKPVWCVNHGPTISFYYKDTDGNMLETQVDNFDDAEAANEFMFGPEFAENPIGVDLEPEDLIDRIRKGESEASIKKRANIGSRHLPPNF